MNDIYELMEIIRNLGQKADFLSICTVYQKQHKMFLSQNHRIVIEKLLNNNREIIEKDEITGIYKIIDRISVKENDVSNDKHENYHGFNFESDQCKQSLKVAKTIINEFKEKYPLESIKDLSLDEFIISPKGKGNDQSFCRMLRYDLQCVCSMGNAWPTTFEIYKNGDDVIKLSPTFEKEFGTNYDSAFKETKQRIVLFLEAAKNKDTEAMNSIKLNAQFKYKLAAVYFDDIYYPGAVREYLKQSCARLGISFDENNMFNNMLEIANWKNKHDDIKNINNHTLMNYTDYLIRSDLSMSDVTIENNPYRR